MDTEILNIPESLDAKIGASVHADIETGEVEQKHFTNLEWIRYGMADRAEIGW